MSADTVFDSNEILRRLETLERQNRRFKRAGLAVLLAGTALLAMAQTRPMGPLKASEFDLVDGAGKISAVLGISGAKPMLSMIGPSGAAEVRLGWGQGPSPFFSLVDGARHAAVLGLGNDSYELNLQTSDQVTALFEGGQQPMISLPGTHFGLSSGVGLILLGGDNPNVEVRDSAGFSAVLGDQSLRRERAGSSENTSAAFLGLFDKDGTILWSTPH